MIHIVVTIRDTERRPASSGRIAHTYGSDPSSTVDAPAIAARHVEEALRRMLNTEVTGGE